MNDDLLRSILNIATAAWLLLWATVGIRRIFLRRRDSVCFVFITHFALCGLPLLLDYLVGPTNYRFWPGLDIAAADLRTHTAYCAYVGLCPLIWWYFGRTRKSSERGDVSWTVASLRNVSWIGKSLLHLLLFAPIVALWCAPHPQIYADYAAVIRGVFAPEDLAYHPVITACTLLSAIGGAALLIAQRRLRFTACYVLPFAAVAAWLDGKRAVVLIVIAVFWIALWSRGALKRRALLLLGPTVMAAFLAFSVSYQSGIRGLNTLDAAQRYDNFRLDYGRDHIIRMALFSELHPDAQPILDYRLQTLLFDISMFVPRDIWPDKPWPYAVYATAAALRVPVRFLGWGATTSWLDEAIANFGLIGVFVGPLLIALICRAGDATHDTILRMFTILLSSMFLALQVAAFSPLVLVWVMTIAFTRRSRRNCYAPRGRMQNRRPEYRRSIPLTGVQHA